MFSICGVLIHVLKDFRGFQTLPHFVIVLAETLPGRTRPISKEAEVESFPCSLVLKILCLDYVYQKPNEDNVRTWIHFGLQPSPEYNQLKYASNLRLKIVSSYLSQIHISLIY